MEKCRVDAAQSNRQFVIPMEMGIHHGISPMLDSCLRRNDVLFDTMILFLVFVWLCFLEFGVCLYFSFLMYKLSTTTVKWKIGLSTLRR
jgi:hypothetical protein